MMYYPIDETTARRAHEMMSMRDYTPGSTTAEYRRMVDQAAALVERQKQKVSPFYHDKLDALLDRYARRMAQPQRCKLSLHLDLRRCQFPHPQKGAPERQG